MKSHQLQRLSVFTLASLALFAFSLNFGVADRLIRSPDIGAIWSRTTGIVHWVDAYGPAAGQLQFEDRVLTVDGVPTQDSLLVPDKRPGEVVKFHVQRDGNRLFAFVVLVSPTITVILSRLEPLLIALAFGLLGVFILAFSPLGSQSILAFLFCQASSATLALGVLSPLGPPWAAELFGFLLWWIGPLAIHFHLHFPQPIFRRRTPFITVIYLLTILGVLLTSPLNVQFAVGAISMVSRLWLGLSLGGVVFLLVRAYRHVASPERQQQVGLVSLGGLIAFTPILVFSLLPDALLHYTLLPYEVTFLFLLAVPVAYGYAIQRYRLLRIERYVNRGVVFALMLILLGGSYLLLYMFFVYLLPLEIQRWPLVNLLIVLVMSLIFSPMWHQLQIIVNHIFYGGWYDYRRAVEQISRSLENATDSRALAHTLCQEIQQVLQLECACLLILDNKGGAASGSACCNCAIHQAGGIHLEACGRLNRYLQSQVKPVEVNRLRAVLGQASLSENEKQLLACARAQLWIPLSGREQSIGTLILGLRRGGGNLGASDLAVLDVVIRQADVAFKNAYLVTELQQRILEGERLNQKVLYAGEEERKRLARELHDQIIQDLIGLNYHLSEVRGRLTPEFAGQIIRMQEEVRGILGGVRRICADLRPPALDSLGLVAAIRSRIREMENKTTVQIHLTVIGNEDQDLPEEVAVCIFRVFQEGILNIHKHAAARSAEIELRINENEVLLSVTDDGLGFTLPGRLGQLTSNGHFGLLGSRERLDLISGTLEVVSAPHRGTRLVARVPLPSASTRYV